MQKGDTAGAMQATLMRWRVDTRNKPILMGLIQLRRLRRDWDESIRLLDTGLVVFPGDEQLIELKTTVCIEGERPCAVDALGEQLRRDPTKARDSTFLKVAIGAAQQHKRVVECRRFAGAAATAFPTSSSFWKARGACFADLEPPALDSALWAYRRAADLDPTDVAGALLVAKTMVDATTWDTMAVKGCSGDTSCVSGLRARFADRLDTARVYIDRGLTAADSSLRTSAAVILLGVGSKVAQAAAYGRAYPVLERVLEVAQPRTVADTSGPRHQIRVQASFWWGLSSILTLGPPFQEAVASKDCERVKPVIDRLVRTKEALQLGRTVHDPTARQMLGYVAQYEANVPRIRTAYKCRNF
jgi:hypothetical protein